jgi:peptidoglycan/LPS O-acetylase OafA/YrhL
MQAAIGSVSSKTKAGGFPCRLWPAFPNSCSALIAQLYLVCPDLRSNVEKRQARWIGIAGALWIVGSFLACYVYIYFQVSFGFAPGIAALIFIFARYRGRVAALVETPIVVALGDASYSIYMLHGFALFYVMKQSPYMSPIWRIAMAWGLTAVLSLESGPWPTASLIIKPWPVGSSMMTWPSSARGSRLAVGGFELFTASA